MRNNKIHTGRFWTPGTGEKKRKRELKLYKTIFNMSKAKTKENKKTPKLKKNEMENKSRKNLTK